MYRQAIHSRCGLQEVRVDGLEDEQYVGSQYTDHKFSVQPAVRGRMDHH
jgi:hypothetical protein